MLKSELVPVPQGSPSMALDLLQQNVVTPRGSARNSEARAQSLLRRFVVLGLLAFTFQRKSVLAISGDGWGVKGVPGGGSDPTFSAVFLFRFPGGSSTFH